MTYPRIAAAVLTVLALTGCAVTAPTTATTPDTVLSLPSSSPIAPWPGPDAPISSAPASDGPAPAVTTDPGTGATTDPGAAAPAATRAATTKAAAPKTTTAPAAPKTTAAAPKTTAPASTVWVAYKNPSSSCQVNVQTGEYRGCVSVISNPPTCVYNTTTGRTTATFTYFGASTSSAYTITIAGHTFAPVRVGQGPGSGNAGSAGQGTCLATIS